MFKSVDLKDFYNKYTLNIFSDASILGKGKTCTGCYGVVCVFEDTLVDSCYHIVSHTTNNDSELKGIRTALSFANKYKDQFKYINIFSDSKISIDGLRYYIYNWKYNSKNGLLYTSTGKPAANQSLFIECNQLLNLLGEYPYCVIKLFHQNGHVGNTYNELKRSANTFASSNNIYQVDLNLMRYISTYNNIVDITSRKILRSKGICEDYVDPLSFGTNEKIHRIIYNKIDK